MYFATNSYDIGISEELNSFFKNATNSLEIKENAFLLEYVSETLPPIEKAILKFKNHPSILTIKSKLEVSKPFLFHNIAVYDIETR